MPELPEVENTRISLLPVKNSKIINIYSDGKKLRQDIPTNLQEIVGSTVLDIGRIAKYLLFHLSNQKTIISHLGMSGKFVYSNNEDVAKHDHVILYFDGGYNLKYNDPRRFGVFLLEDTFALKDKYFSNVAMDAIENGFTAEYLLNRLNKISSNIKNTLLNQEIVAGIGNIYASEALFAAKISPLRAANSLNITEAEVLVATIKEILNRSIKLGGSTLKDYRKANGESGDFQNHFLVYSKENQPCQHEGCKGTITKITQNGRSTFYCPLSQR
ncbi:MAG: bifunctional DNA-formamidopyrimidine glycosylase/DNA-(apurinic or apyrimidinic site) lyase [Alphaproteobacteria bacterium]|jgi:formamidopyrimidine-DNA glycosylase|nr:bifunctional DNA-formamidopyrimidine glycosylase/DNA-(apurinic or apyrimidinic site) lyase [Alphaproteobacteria bacterium]